MDAVYIDAKKTKSVVAIKSKPLFKPVFQVAASKKESKIRILNEPLQGSRVFLVETGEGGTPPTHIAELVKKRRAFAVSFCGQV